MKLPPVLLAVLVGAAAWATETTVNQGSPGTRGPWPVVIIGGGTADGGTSSSSVSTTPEICTGNANKNTSVGVAAGNTPATQLTSRRYLILCNSLQNSGNPSVKCRADGTAPVMAAGNAGDVMGIGDCILYPLAAVTVIQCISDTASTNVTSSECQ